jgi:hypothetical protein
MSTRDSMVYIIKNWVESGDLTEKELNLIIHFCNGGDAIRWNEERRSKTQRSQKDD